MGLDIVLLQPTLPEQVSDSVKDLIREKGPDLNKEEIYGLSEFNSLKSLVKYIFYLDFEVYDYERALAKLGLDGRKYEIVVGSKETSYKNDLVLIERGYIYATEIGYQRKGANKLFYRNGIWDSQPVVKLSTLQKHHLLYFSGEDTDEPKIKQEYWEEFQNNIVSKFIEGETFVLYG